MSPFLRAVEARRMAMHDEARAVAGHHLPRCHEVPGDEGPPRAPSEPLTDAVVRLRRAGMPVVAIALRLGTTHTTVYRYLRLAGVTDGIRPWTRRVREVAEAF